MRPSRSTQNQSRSSDCCSSGVMRINAIVSFFIAADASGCFDFVGGGFYKCGCHRNSIHDSLAAQCWAVQVTTAIIRMFGKAVKFRHCPATVSAPGSMDVGSGDGWTTGAWLREGDGQLTTKKFSSGDERRESGDRSLMPNQLAFRGERRSRRCHSICLSD